MSMVSSLTCIDKMIIIIYSLIYKQIWIGKKKEIMIETYTTIYRTGE
jgi:hypothetical protein